jgi:uncharacterized protein YuzE
MREPTYTYDEVSDTLTISYLSGETATGIELTDHILLRVDKANRSVVSITLFDYSLLTQTTAMGVRSFPLTGIHSLAESTRDFILESLQQEPIRDVIELLAYTPSSTEQIPIVTVRQIGIPAA